MPNPDENPSRGAKSADLRAPLDIALIGHDLRAALSEVIGGLRLIPPESLPPTARLQVARSKAASEALSLLVDQALGQFLGPSSCGQPAILQTDRLFNNLKLRWTPRLRAVGQELYILADPDLPSHLGLDPAMFERVIANLLGNAVKYAGPGRVVCNIGLLSQHMLQVSVQDEGAGFALADLTPSARDPVPHGKPGTGLGLVIVRELVEASGGTMVLQNGDTGGAKVIVTLPLGPIDASMLPKPESSPPPDLSHLRILLADDSPTHRILHQKLLTKMGAEVIVVSNGSEAIGRIERESFDLAIVDVEMPNFNGLEVIQHIRGMAGGLSKLPVLALTSHMGQVEKARITAVGADGYLAKPVSTLVQFGVAVLHAQLNRELGQKLGAKPQVNPDQFASLLQMAGPEAAVEVLKHIHHDLGCVERDLIAASQEPDWVAVRNQSHVLIALAGTAGADVLSQQAQHLNRLAHEPQPDLASFSTLLQPLLESLHELRHFIAGKVHEYGAKV